MHFDNLLFLLLVLVAMLLRVLASAAKKARKSSNQTQRRSTATPPPLPRVPVESDAERIRKFLEALGQPAGAETPPSVKHRTELPPRPVAPVQAPREMVAGPLPQHRTAPKRVQLPGQIATAPHALETARPQTSAPVYEVQQTPPAPEPLPPLVIIPAAAYAAATKPTIAPVERTIDVRVMLASTSGLRDAVILREIFGPPRSLQPLELIGV